MAVVAELQDEVERILRRLNLEETSAVAQHLQIENVEDLTSQREVLRRIQETFDGAANDETKDGMLRDLPIPDAHRQAYLRLLEPPHGDENGPVVPGANANGVAAADQVVPLGDGDPVVAPDAGRGNEHVGFLNVGGFQPLGVQNHDGLPQLNPQDNIPAAHYAGVYAALNAGGANTGVLNAGAANAVNVGPNTGGFDLGVVAQNRLYNGGLMQQNIMNSGAQNVLNNGVFAQNAVGGTAQNLRMQSPLNVPGIARPRGVMPQNNVVRAQNNGAGTAQNIWSGYPQSAQNLGGVQNMQPVMQFPNYPQQRFVQMFPREFRMTGTICDDISKSMTYLDICRQVQDGRRKGYSDDEILSGMRRVMTTGSVKTYVDSQVNQPLEDTLLFLRSFLKTETPSELNNKLSQLAQQEDELAISFFMTALKTRQLIVVGSQVEGNVSYDPKLVHSTFLHTIRTGLRDESVRSHMLPFLSESTMVDDNTLIRELHKAVAEAEERRKKTEKSHEKAKPVKVNAVETSPELAAVMKLLQENQNQMKVMQEQVGELLAANPAVKKINSRWKKKGSCQACTAAGKGDSCQHCWKCGEDGHKSPQCTKPPN